MAEISDEMLMAFADGQLEAAEAARVAEVVAADADLMRRLSLYEATSAARLARPFNAALEQEIPERLMKAARMLDAARRRSAQPQRAWLSGWVGRIAEGFGGMLPAGVSPAFGALGLAAGVIVLATGARLAAQHVPEPDVFRVALETARSGDAIRFAAEDGRRTITPHLSFRNQSGDFCRKYAIARANRTQIEGVACRDAKGTWRVDMEAEGGQVIDRSRPSLADSGSSMAIEDRIGELISGAAFDREQEDRALRSGWKKS